MYQVLVSINKKKGQPVFRPFVHKSTADFYAQLVKVNRSFDYSNVKTRVVEVK